MFYDPIVFILFLLLITVVVGSIVYIFVKFPKVFVMVIFVAVILFCLATCPTVAETFTEEEGVIIKVAPSLLGNNPILIVSVETTSGDVYQYFADGEIEVDSVVRLLLYGEEIIEVENVENDYNLL